MNIASEIMTCRVCLITNVKMYDMNSHRIKTVYENLMNTEVFEKETPSIEFLWQLKKLCYTKYQIQLMDQMDSKLTIPAAEFSHQYICIYCTALLFKFSQFKEKCLKSQHFLKNSGAKSNKISHVINHEDIKPNDIYPPYKIHHAEVVDIPPVKLEDVIIYSTDQNDENNFLDDNFEFKDVKTDESDEKTDDIDDRYDYIDDNTDNNGFTVDSGSNLDNVMNDYENNAIFHTDDIMVDNIVTVETVLSSEESDDECLSKKNRVKDKQLNYGISDNNEIDVIVLKKEEQIREVEDRKYSYNYTSSYYKCEYCYKGFMTDGTYRNHMIRHDPSSGPMVCEICNTRWPDVRALKAHALITHERKYVCRLCNNTSRNLSKAKEHQNWHNGFKFVCKVCGAVYNKSTTYLTHLRTQHPTQHKHFCDICGVSFISGIGLRMHEKKVHRESEKTFQCSICKVQFANKEALIKHNKSKVSCRDSKLIPCLKCGKNFSDEDTLKVHLESHQKDDAVDCPFCHKSFSNQRTLGVHYQRFHVGKSKRDKDPKKMDWVCEICGVRCVSKTMLQYHQRTHTGEKPYKCPECPKSFRIHQSLQIHVRIHTGESPFKCTQCPKAFKHKAGLNRHNRVHTGVKPYTCPHCGKSFSQSNSMKLHVSTVHLKMPAPYKNRVKKRINDA